MQIITNNKNTNSATTINSIEEDTSRDLVDNANTTENKDIDNDEFTKGVKSAILEVKKDLEDKGISSEPDSKEQADDSVNVDKHTEDDPLLRVASKKNGIVDNDKNNNAEKDSHKIVISDEHKSAFIHSIITGERYTELFQMFGKNFIIKIRSRTNEETEAIQAYLRQMISRDKIRTDYDYSELVRKLLCLAQVEEINGVKYHEMAKPLFFEETDTGRTPPAWEKDLAIWEKKQDAIISVLIKCIVDFEARYWSMVNKSDDENFWLPGESTGE